MLTERATLLEASRSRCERIGTEDSLQIAYTCTVAQKTAPMFAYYVKTHVLLNADII